MKRSKNVIKFRGKPVCGPRILRDEPGTVIILPVIRIEGTVPNSRRGQRRRIAIKGGGAA
jgi:hypothetical protein